MQPTILLRAVLHTLLLAACASIVSHHLFNVVWEEAKQNELWTNMTRSLDLMDAIHKNSTSSSQSLTPNNITLENGTLAFANITSHSSTSTSDDTKPAEESYYKKSLPRELLLLAFSSPLYYMLHIWLERTFPGRPRRTAANTTSENDHIAVGEDDTREEELIRRLIAEGKIHRATLSWWNTFVKWILTLTIGTLLIDGIVISTISQLIRFRLPTIAFFQQLKYNAPITTIYNLFSLRPFALLIAFTIIPAHQRIVFEAGVNLIWAAFAGTVVKIVLPWLATTEVVNIIIANMTAHAEKRRMGMGSLGDEL